MGCFDGTCMVSNLSIRHGDPCYGFLIGRALSSSRLTGPLCFPVLGKYDDYGGIEVAEVPWWNQAFEKTVKEMWEDKLWEDEEEEQPLSFADVVYACRRNSLIEISAGLRRKFKIGFALVHKKVLDIATEAVAENERPSLKKVLSDFDLARKMFKDEPPLVGRYLNPMYLLSSHPLWVDTAPPFYKSFLSNLLESEAPLEKIAKEAVDLRIFVDAMFFLRKPFASVELLGEQHDDGRLALDFIKKLFHFSGEIVKKRNGDEEE